jgi:predicted glycosyl hydrolase (DUF1957 family)
MNTLTPIYAIQLRNLLCFSQKRHWIENTSLRFIKQDDISVFSHDYKLTSEDQIKRTHYSYHYYEIACRLIVLHHTTDLNVIPILAF